MARRYWVIGGEYADPDFRSLVPGTERMVGPFEDERKAHNEWLRLTCRPGTCSATIRYGIASEAIQ
jgi:hypothetical protein